MIQGSSAARRPRGAQATTARPGRHRHPSQAGGDALQRGGHGLPQQPGRRLDLVGGRAVAGEAQEPGAVDEPPHTPESLLVGQLGDHVMPGEKPDPFTHGRDQLAEQGDVAGQPVVLGDGPQRAGVGLPVAQAAGVTSR